MSRLVALGISLAAACGGGKSPAADAHPGADAPASPDADPILCTAASGTAAVTVALGSASPVSYAVLQAGATWEVGPVASQGMSAPMTVELLFTNLTELTGSAALCCDHANPTCCGSKGLLATSESLLSGAELGAHAVTFENVLGSSAAVPGTLTISAFTQPFENAPGHIVGSVSATSGTATISGTFDNVFCAALLVTTL